MTNHVLNATQPFGAAHHGPATRFHAQPKLVKTAQPRAQATGETQGNERKPKQKSVLFQYIEGALEPYILKQYTSEKWIASIYRGCPGALHIETLYF